MMHFLLEGAFGGWFDMVLSLCKLAMDMFIELYSTSTNLCACVCALYIKKPREREHWVCCSSRNDWVPWIKVGDN